MPKGHYNTPHLCKNCGKAPATRDYCKTCGPIIKKEKKKESDRRMNPLGLLIVAGVKRAPSITIVEDPLQPGGFSSGIKFSGKDEIKSMLTTGAFTDGTIVKAGTRVLRIVNSKFEVLENGNKT